MKIPSRIRITLLTVLCCAAFSPLARAGYDLHITRAKDWTQSKTTPVPLEEWVQYVKSDSEFELVQPQPASDKFKDAIWVDPTDKRETYFFYSDGEITVKDVDERIIAKIKKVAAKLKAKVIGDDGEEYK